MNNVGYQIQNCLRNREKQKSRTTKKNNLMVISSENTQLKNITPYVHKKMTNFDN